LVHEFVHEVELDFGGFRSYSFTDVVPANSYTALTGEYLLFGIDAGFPSGRYGPSFSSPSVTTTFDIVTLIETEIIDIISDIINTNIPVGETVTDVEIAVNTPSGDLVTTMEMEIEPPMEIQSIAIAPTLAPPPTEAQTAEANIEAEIQTEIQDSVEPEPASEPEPTPSESADAVLAPATIPPRQRERVAERRPLTQREKVKAAAQQIVKKIAPSQRYSAANQTTTLVVMNLISARVVTDLVIQDKAAATFFVESTVPDGPSVVDPMTSYRLFGKANGAHSALVESQWNR
jgi:hypothetical protein